MSCSHTSFDPMHNPAAVDGASTRGPEHVSGASTSALAAVQAVLSSLTVDEANLASPASVSDRIAALRAAIDTLDSADTPWLGNWLRDEHWKAGVLFAAARVNWILDQRGEGTAGQRRMRAHLIKHFNAWSTEAHDRIGVYERGRRDAASVAAWLSELERFKNDPLRNL